MPVNLSVKNVPDELARRLRDRAAGNHRSLQRELVSILEQAVADTAPDAERRDRGGPVPGRRTVEEVIAELHAIFPQPRFGGPSSTDLLRQMREARKGDATARRSARKAS